MIATERLCREVPRAQRDPDRPPLADILIERSGGEAIVHAHCDHGYRLSEIARVLGLHPNTIGRRLRSAERRAG